MIRVPMHTSGVTEEKFDKSLHFILLFLIGKLIMGRIIRQEKLRIIGKKIIVKNFHRDSNPEVFGFVTFALSISSPEPICS